MKIYAAAIGLVWFVFTIIWFSYKQEGGFLGNFLLYIVISVGINMGGIVIGALALTSPTLMILGIGCLVIFFFALAGGKIVVFFI